MTDRRRFSRIAFDAPALLSGANGDFAVRVVDLSLKGVLLEVGPHWSATADEAGYQLTISLSPGTHVRALLQFSHASGERAGFIYRRIDLESMEHLRRFVELNLGDDALLQRELGDLISD